MAAETAVPGKVDQNLRPRNKEYFSFRSNKGLAPLVKGISCDTALVFELPSDAFLARGWGTYRPDHETRDLVVAHLAFFEAAIRIKAPVVFELLYDDEIQKGCGKLHERGTRMWILLEHPVKSNELNSQLFQIAAPTTRETDEPQAKRRRQGLTDAEEHAKMLTELEMRYGRRCGFQLLTPSTLIKAATMWCMGDAGHVNPDRLMLGITPTTIDDWDEEGVPSSRSEGWKDSIVSVLDAHQVFKANVELGKYAAWNLGEAQQCIDTYLEPSEEREGYVFRPGAEIAADTMRLFDFRGQDSAYIHTANDLLRLAGFLDVPTKDEMVGWFIKNASTRGWILDRIEEKSESELRTLLMDTVTSEGIEAAADEEAVDLEAGTPAAHAVGFVDHQSARCPIEQSDVPLMKDAGKENDALLYRESLQQATAIATARDEVLDGIMAGHLPSSASDSNLFRSQQIVNGVLRIDEPIPGYPHAWQRVSQVADRLYNDLGKARPGSVPWRVMFLRSAAARRSDHTFVLERLVEMLRGYNRMTPDQTAHAFLGIVMLASVMRGRWNEHLSSGILVQGEPGCGKSYAWHTVLRHGGCTVIRVTTESDQAASYGGMDLTNVYEDEAMAQVDPKSMKTHTLTRTRNSMMEDGKMCRRRANHENDRTDSVMVATRSRYLTCANNPMEKSYSTRFIGFDYGAEDADNVCPARKNGEAVKLAFQQLSEYAVAASAFQYAYQYFCLLPEPDTTLRWVFEKMVIEAVYGERCPLVSNPRQRKHFWNMCMAVHNYCTMHLWIADVRRKELRKPNTASFLTWARSGAVNRLRAEHVVAAFSMTSVTDDDNRHLVMSLLKDAIQMEAGARKTFESDPEYLITTINTNTPDGFDADLAARAALVGIATIQLKALIADILLNGISKSGKLLLIKDKASPKQPFLLHESVCSDPLCMNANEKKVLGYLATLPRAGVHWEWPSQAACLIPSEIKDELVRGRTAELSGIPVGRVLENLSGIMVDDRPIIEMYEPGQAVKAPITTFSCTLADETDPAAVPVKRHGPMDPHVDRLGPEYSMDEDTADDEYELPFIRKTICNGPIRLPLAAKRIGTFFRRGINPFGRQRLQSLEERVDWFFRSSGDGRPGDSVFLGVDKACASPKSPIKKRMTLKDDPFEVRIPNTAYTSPDPDEDVLAALSGDCDDAEGVPRNYVELGGHGEHFKNHPGSYIVLTDKTNLGKDIEDRIDKLIRDNRI